MAKSEKIQLEADSHLFDDGHLIHDNFLGGLSNPTNSGNTDLVGGGYSRFVINNPGANAMPFHGGCVRMASFGCHWPQCIQAEPFGERLTSKSQNACPFNALYWDFLARNENSLAQNPRLLAVYRRWYRMDEKQRADYRSSAQDFLNCLN